MRSLWRNLAVVTAGVMPLVLGPVAAPVGRHSPAASAEVTTFAGNAQHTGVYEAAAMDLNAIRWSTPIDLRQTFGTTHYGAPLVTASNTIIVPVKTASDGFQLRAFDAATGKPRYSTIGTDYVLPAHNWIPTYAPALATIPGQGRNDVRRTRLYFAGAGGTLFYVSGPDLPRHSPPVRVAFYGLDAYRRDPASFNASVFVNTPLTTDSQGNVFFGFRVQGLAPGPLSTTQSGFARIAPDGAGTYVLAGAAAGDTAIARDSHNSAPALSNDEQTLYAVVKAGTTNAYAYLLGLDATTLATRFKVFLKDPRNNHANNASVTDDSTASPMVAPDGDVYFGVFANPNNGSRGFLLRFSGDLSVEKTPGAFGWDSTAAVVPASMVPSYRGPSSYLIFTKYNNYRFGDGDGVNRIALLDPNVRQIDPHTTAGGLIEMREVLTVIGPTPDGPTISPAFPNAVREWCINTAAVNPATRSIFVPNEDGRLYRWDLSTNSLSQAVALTPGYGEPYVPTIIGPDGTVFTLNGGTLFAVGAAGRIAVTVASSVADTRLAVAGDSLTFTASVALRGWFHGQKAAGSVIFRDQYYPDAIATPASTDLARVPIANGLAAFTTSALAPGSHIITATHDMSGSSVTFVQKIHAFATTTVLTAAPQQFLADIKITATVTAPVGVPTGMMTFSDLQVPLDSAGSASIFTPLIAARTITGIYASDSTFAASCGVVVVSGSPLPPTGCVNGRPVGNDRQSILRLRR